MEFPEILILVLIIFSMAVSGILLFKFIPNNSKIKRKINTKDEMDVFLNSKIKQIQEMYEEQIKILKQERNSAQGAANRMRKINADLKSKFEEDYDEEEDDYEDLLTNYDVDWNKAVQVGKQMGLAVENFDSNDVAIKEIIQQKILEHKDLAYSLGIIKPRGQVTPQQNSSQQDPVEALIEEAAKTGNIA